MYINIQLLTCFDKLGSPCRSCLPHEAVNVWGCPSILDKRRNGIQEFIHWHECYSSADIPCRSSRCQLEANSACIGGKRRRRIARENAIKQQKKTQAAAQMKEESEEQRNELQIAENANFWNVHDCHTSAVFEFHGTQRVSTCCFFHPGLHCQKSCSGVTEEQITKLILLLNKTICCTENSCESQRRKKKKSNRRKSDQHNKKNLRDRRKRQKSQWMTGSPPSLCLQSPLCCLSPTSQAPRNTRR